MWAAVSLMITKNRYLLSRLILFAGLFPAQRAQSP
jgi:hypothetical protein